MIDPERAFARLQDANPFPVATIERPSAEEFLQSVGDTDLTLVAPIRRRWSGPLIAAAAVAFVLAVALPILFTRSDAPSPPVATTPEVSETPDGVDLPELVPGVESFVSGSYTTDLLGTPLALEFPVTWSQRYARPGSLQFTGPQQAVQLTLFRPTSLSEPTTADTDDPRFGWPLDLPGWLAATPGISIEQETQYELSGYVTRELVFSVADSTALMTNARIDDVVLDSQQTHAIWWIEQPVGGPIVVVASAGPGFLADARQVVVSFDLGDATRHPIDTSRPWELGFTVSAPAGEIRVPALGGVAFENPDERTITQDDDLLQLGVTDQSDVGVAFAVRTAEEQPVSSVGEIVAYLGDAGVVLDERQLQTLSMGEARVFDLTRATASRNTALWVSDTRRWFVPATARLWLVETERGVLLISAGSLESDLGLAEAIAAAEAVVPTIQFIEPPG